VAEYLIRCVNTEHPHSHIVSAVVQRLEGDHYLARQTLDVSRVLSMMDDGDVFNTYSKILDDVTPVHPQTCREAGCEVQTIRSDKDAVEDNNLDNLICP
jgi:hypothetical protein